MVACACSHIPSSPSSLLPAVDKAIFIKDVEAYKSMRFESARRKIAKLLYQRFVAPESDVHDFKKGSSVFQIIQQRKNVDDEKEKDGKPGSPGAVGSGSGGDKLGEKTQMSTNLSQSSQMTSPALSTNQQTTINTNGADRASESRPNRGESMLQMGTANNSIGVYGKSVRTVRDRVTRGKEEGAHQAVAAGCGLILSCW